MKKTLKAIPSFADLSLGTPSAVPFDLVNRWADGDGSQTLATELLDPFRITGLVACSDMSGLSRMTQRLPLLQVLRLVSLPKEWIHASTTAIGGRAIGTWIADNTETFFPESVSPDEILRAILNLHRRLPQDLPEMGFCLHRGDFYCVGGGLYGADADLVEYLAEEETVGGETLLTAAVLDRLRHPEAFQWERREDLAKYGEIYRAVAGPSLGEFSPLGSTGYPAPFPEELRRALGSADLPEDALAQYQCEKSALLVRLCRDRAPSGPAELLDELAQCALLEVLVRKALSDVSTPHKTGGRLAIAVFGNAEEALEVALRIRRLASRDGMTVCCGIDHGGMLVFPMPDGRWEFAGEPINFASKQAEDCGVPGWIYLTRRSAQGLTLSDAQPCQWQVSGVRINSLGLPPEA